MASKKRDRTSDVLKALRERGGTAQIGLIASDLGIQPTSTYHHINPLLENGTLEVVKRGVIKILRDPNSPTDLGSDNVLDVEDKTNIAEGSKKKVEEEKEVKEKKHEAPVEEEKEEKKKVILKDSSDLKPIEQEIILNITFKVKLEFN